MPLDPAFEAGVRKRLSASPFAQWMGIRLVGIDEGRSEIALDLEEHHLNPGGIVHGGIIATVLDAAIGLALRTTLGPSGGHVTVQLDIHYLAPAVTGALIARGTAVHRGKRVGYGEARAYTEDERLIATAAATFLVVDTGPAPQGD